MTRIGTGIKTSLELSNRTSEHRSNSNLRGVSRQRQSANNALPCTHRIGLTTRSVVTPFLSVYLRDTTKSSGEHMALLSALISIEVIFESSLSFQKTAFSTHVRVVYLSIDLDLTRLVTLN